MRKIHFLIIIIFSLLILSSCNNNDINFIEHQYKLSYDDENHFNLCECGDKDNIEPHQYEITTKHQPTCLDKGLDEYRCKICNYVKYVETEALGHQLKTIDGIEASCTSIGKTEKIECARCGNILKESELLNMLSHDYNDYETITEATCDTEGVISRTCKNCNHEETKTIPSLGHDFTDFEVSVPATCTQSGLEKRTCKNCNHEETKKIEAHGHDYNDYEISVPASCIQSGLEIRTCKNCDKLETRTINPLGHDPIISSTGLKPTCLDKGSTKEISCSRCNKILEEKEILPAAGHNLSSSAQVVLDPTYKHPGISRAYCKDCKEYITYETPRLEITNDTITNSLPDSKKSNYCISYKNNNEIYTFKRKDNIEYYSYTSSSNHIEYYKITTNNIISLFKNDSDSFIELQYDSSNDILLQYEEQLLSELDNMYSYSDDLISSNMDSINPIPGLISLYCYTNNDRFNFYIDEYGLFHKFKAQKVNYEIKYDDEFDLKLPESLHHTQDNGKCSICGIESKSYEIKRNDYTDVFTLYDDGVVEHTYKNVTGDIPSYSLISNGYKYGARYIEYYYDYEVSYIDLESISYNEEDGVVTTKQANLPITVYYALSNDFSYRFETKYETAAMVFNDTRYEGKYLGQTFIDIQSENVTMITFLYDKLITVKCKRTNLYLKDDIIAKDLCDGELHVFNQKSMGAMIFKVYNEDDSSEYINEIEIKNGVITLKSNKRDYKGNVREITYTNKHKYFKYITDDNKLIIFEVDSNNDISYFKVM